jgi:carbonic anhydrase
MSVTDGLLENTQRYAEGFDKGGLPMPPGKHVAVVACMDARSTPTASSACRRARPTSSATRGAS